MTKNRIARRKQLRKRRRFFTLTLSGIFILVILLCGARTQRCKSDIEYTTHIVHKGDTLWEIANCYSDDSIDTRDVIRQIEELNSLDDATIYCGDYLIVPVYKK